MTHGQTKLDLMYPASWLLAAGIASVPISATSLSLAALEAWSLVKADIHSLSLSMMYDMCEYIYYINMCMQSCF